MTKEEKLAIKLHEMKEYEEALYSKGLTYIAGVDEVGRGPLAGPVTAAAVVLPKDFYVLGIDDSKKLSEKRREELFEKIKDGAICYGIGMVENKVIDEINILEATKSAMKKAIFQAEENLKKVIKEKKFTITGDRETTLPDVREINYMGIEHVLIDAVTLKDVSLPQTGIIKGDSKSVSIAAASILAKVTRDRLMVEYSKIYPYYAFERNKGYGTKAHYEGIAAHGICKLHRKTFLKGRF